MSNKSNYIKALQKDKKTTDAYYLKSLNQKTEQQKFLEKLLKGVNRQEKPLEVADIACGAGSLSYHLSKLRAFSEARFQMVDYNPSAIKLARKHLRGGQFLFDVGSVYNLDNYKTGQFDMVFCWQTLSWLDEPAKALNELIRIARKGGKIYLSSLFNIDHDVDVYSRVIDHSHSSSRQNMSFNYNTYSSLTVKKWLKGRVKNYKLHPFHMPVTLPKSGRGLGTYTVKAAGKKNMQISGGMLLNWAVLEITK